MDFVKPSFSISGTYPNLHNQKLGPDTTRIDPIGNYILIVAGMVNLMYDMFMGL